MALKHKKENYCIKQERTFLLEEFYKSDNPLHNGYIPFCKVCCSEILHDYLVKTESLEKGIYFACAELGIPFIDKAFTMLKDETITRKIVNHPVIRSRYDYIEKYLFYLDKVKKENINTGIEFKTFINTDVGFESIFALGSKDIEVKEFIIELKQSWGNRTMPQYDFLEEEMDRYLKDLGKVPHAQKVLLRRLCIRQLELREIQEEDRKSPKHSIGKDEKDKTIIVEASIVKLMTTLKLNNFIEKKELTEFEKTLENQIAIVETKKPSFYFKDLEKYADFMGIEKYWKDHVIRPLRNILTGSKEYNILPEKKTPSKTKSKKE